ncbi:hypothetical protein [Bradyrhizobium ottawaense]|uniref:hypothetical protein n=1 Tax=Bradyrhizobium ottawaense TaxID=931866 RepID=UPI001FDFDFEE|nr:hypothetical protein [Bradyrhizobium ottawaense]
MQLASAAAAALIALSPRSASAQSWTGTTSSDWTVGSNWSGGAVPIAGNLVNINTTSPNPTILGVGGAAAGATGRLTVGNTTGSFGNLTIQNGSTLTTSGATIAIGVAGGSNGTVTVSGAGSQWTTSGAQIEIGASGNGTLNIQNGARVVAQAGVLLEASPPARARSISTAAARSRRPSCLAPVGEELARSISIMPSCAPE